MSPALIVSTDTSLVDATGSATVVAGAMTVLVLLVPVVDFGTDGVLLDAWDVLGGLFNPVKETAAAGKANIDVATSKTTHRSAAATLELINMHNPQNYFRLK